MEEVVKVGGGCYGVGRRRGEGEEERSEEIVSDACARAKERGWG